MGNWCTMTHWFECAQPGEARAVLGALRSACKHHRWVDPERWALRAGMLSPTLVQAESFTKWGADVSLGEVARDVDLPAVADVLGGGAVSVDAGERRILCMPAPAPLYLADGRLDEVAERDDPLARLIYAFVAADRHLPGRTSRHLLGLYTPAHGWVHLATLVLDLSDENWGYTGEVSLEDGADHNAVSYAFAEGPFSRSIYVPDTRPVVLTGRWPLV